MPHFLTPAALCAYSLPLGLILAALSDIKTMTIPNRLCIALAVAFLPAAFLAGLSQAQWIGALSLGALGFVLGIGLFAFRIMGGGDAKLIAATCLWVGWQGVVGFITYTALAGGALTLLLLGGRELCRLYVPVLPSWLSRHMQPKGDIPYGIAICVGAIAALPLGPFASYYAWLPWA